MPFLHDHRRRVPPQDIYRSILVCIHTVAAMLTGKSRLVFTASFVYDTTLRAGLRSKLSGDFTHIAPTFFKFVIQ